MLNIVDLLALSVYLRLKVAKTLMYICSSNQNSFLMAYEYCVHFINDPDDSLSIEGELEAEDLEAAKKLVLEEAAKVGVGVDYYWVDGEDDYFSSED